MSPARRRVVVGISGASGAIYGVRALQALRALKIETHLVMSPAAEMTLAYETDFKAKDVRAMADHVHAIANMGASISSGSFKTDGMIVAPCSIRSLAEIAYGNTTTLLTRAADVILKERRRLILLVRETPLHLGHLRAMTQAAEIGAVILPPLPALYARPKTIAEMIDHTVGRALDLLGLDNDLVKRWGDTPKR